MCKRALRGEITHFKRSCLVADKLHFCWNHYPRHSATMTAYEQSTTMNGDRKRRKTKFYILIILTTTFDYNNHGSLL